MENFAKYSYLDIWELKTEMEELAAELRSRWGGGKPVPECFDIEDLVASSFFHATDSNKFKLCDQSGCDKWVGRYQHYCDDCTKERNEDE